MLKIEAKSFRDRSQDIVRIQRVIWDHLLALKGEIIQKQALFSLPCRTPNNSRVALVYAGCLPFTWGNGWSMVCANGKQNSHLEVSIWVKCVPFEQQTRHTERAQDEFDIFK